MLTVVLIGLGLSMDAFSVSVTNGLCMKKIRPKEALIIALFYGFFQFLMPVLGFYAASFFKGYIEAVDHWIAFVLLTFIGIKMISEAIESMKEKDECKLRTLSFKILTIQAIATSIDALAVGVGFAALDIPVFSSSFIIGLITFVLCLAGVFIGKKAGNIFKGKAEILGGIILIGIGMKILIEHLFF